MNMEKFKQWKGTDLQGLTEDPYVTNSSCTSQRASQKALGVWMDCGGSMCITSPIPDTQTHV